MAALKSKPDSFFFNNRLPPKIRYRRFIFQPLTVVFFLVFWEAVAGSAGAVVVQGKTKAFSTPEGISVTVSAVNRSEQPAWLLRANVSAFGKNYESECLEKLDGFRSHDFLFEVPYSPDFLKQCKFPVIGKVLFHTKSGLPSCSYSSQILTIGEDIPPLIKGGNAFMTLETEGTLSFTVENLSGETLRVAATFYPPPGIEVPPGFADRMVELDSKAKERVEFALVNRNGVDKTVYPALCLLEYENNGVYQGAVLDAQIRIKEKKNRLQRNRRLWLLGGIPLLLGWAWVFAAGRKEHGAKTIAN